MKGTGKAKNKGAASGTPLVAILMGSDSDWAVMATTSERLTSFGVVHEAHVLSAHRSPEETARFARDAKQRGLRVFICGAGAAAHLAGMVAGHTAKPVIGVPIDSSPLLGLDALLSTVQMPPGVPVATVAVGRAGATNAGVLAAQMLALGDPALAQRFAAYKERLAEKVEQAAQKLAAQQAN